MSAKVHVLILKVSYYCPYSEAEYLAVLKDDALEIRCVTY